jgi:hypothetical protein
MTHYFLPKGQCLICKTERVKVFKMKCSHTICLEDTKGYLLSALGDISMFPIKCPMHFEGCSGCIDASIARQILNPSQYERYIEFSDRSLYGDGMRCVFCANYVVYPNEMNRLSQVQCPYCIQYFCVRCKKPWHYNKKCIMDLIDNSLEIWKKKSGAQPCPCCKKLIEKDDPDTCNHMVHKITDAIPCIRERTDFCCKFLSFLDRIFVLMIYFSTIDLCGEEVLPDYPHEEARNVGVNHFPDGVFQKCRKVLQKERDAERDLLRKQKRRRNQNSGSNTNTGNNLNTVVPIDGDYLIADGEEGLVWEEILTASLDNNNINTPNPRPNAPPSTPQVIHFPLMEEGEFFPPNERTTTPNHYGNNNNTPNRQRGNSTPINTTNYTAFSAPNSPVHPHHRAHFPSPAAERNVPTINLPVSFATQPPLNGSPGEFSNNGTASYDEEMGMRSFANYNSNNNSPGLSTPPANRLTTPHSNSPTVAGTPPLSSPVRQPRRAANQNNNTNTNNNNNNNSPTRPLRPVNFQAPANRQSNTTSTPPVNNNAANTAAAARRERLQPNQVNSHSLPNSPVVHTRHRLNST